MSFIVQLRGTVTSCCRCHERKPNKVFVRISLTNQHDRSSQRSISRHGLSELGIAPLRSIVTEVCTDCLRSTDTVVDDAE